MAPTLAAQLRAAFPNHPWAADTLQLYGDLLGAFDPVDAAHAVRRAIEELPAPPTVAWLRAAAQANWDRRNPPPVICPNCAGPHPVGRCPQLAPAVDDAPRSDRGSAYAAHIRRILRTAPSIEDHDHRNGAARCRICGEHDLDGHLRPGPLDRNCNRCHQLRHAQCGAATCTVCG